MSELSIDGRSYWTVAQHHLTELGAVVLLAISCGLTNLRLGSLQSQDIVLLGLLWLCITKFFYSGFHFGISFKIGSLSRSYGLFLVALFLLAILATRLSFYPLDQASVLKQPFVFSLSKLLQLLAIVCGFLWLTNSFAKHRTLLNLALNLYWWTGIVSCLYGIACYFVLKLHPFEVPEIFGAYSVDDYIRARGFFNEGGPFGIYIVSVFVIGLARSRVNGDRLGVTWAMVLCVVFVLSGSKAGLLAAVLLTLVWAFSRASIRMRFCYAVLAVSLFVGIGIWLDFDAQAFGYLYSYMNIEEEIATKGEDYSLIMGRVSALHIVPRMIVTHPLAGIGFGNYPLMRNDPDYLNGLPAVTDLEDLPGLGLAGVAAEIGLPATLWLMILLFSPYWLNRKKAFTLALAALFQPVAHILAVQITFFYPWFVTACALGASLGSIPRQAERFN